MKLSYQVKRKSMANNDIIYYIYFIYISIILYIMKTTHQVECKSMADNDCYGGQHFPLVAEDPAQSCRCFGMLRCSGGQAIHQVYQGQMYFDQGH